MMKVVAILRSPRFSPNSEDKDRAIMQAVVSRLEKALNIGIPMVVEDEYCCNPVSSDLILTMGRLPETLNVLAVKEKDGCKVVNSAEGVSLCNHRGKLIDLMRKTGIPVPPEQGNEGVWLKRADAAAQGKGDVVFCKDDHALEKAKEEFCKRGITEIVESAHIVGDLIKFYSAGTMFRYYYPSDDGISKFGDEAVNGKAHHYSFDEAALVEDVRSLAAESGVPVCGGDAIIDGNGNYYIIDFNDWPSFSRCREEAADAIAKLSQFIISK